MADSAVANCEHNLSNAAFIRSLAAALVALLLSAAMLIPTFLLLSPHSVSSGIEDFFISGSDLRPIFGSAKKSGTALQLTELSPEGRAILAYPTRIKAEDFPFFEYTISERNASQTIYLLWRTAENSAGLPDAKLYWTGDRATTIDLSEHKAWTGEITELVVDVYGGLRERPIEFHQLALKPYSVSSRLSSIWAQWSSYRGWTQRSAHQLRGTQTKKDLSPTAVVASWAGLGLVLLFVSSRVMKRQASSNQYLAYALTVFIPWIALDMLWQSELSTQLDETSALFSGKTTQEKRLAEREADLYEYANYLKDTVLPEPGSRIFLLHDTPHRTYTRLKMQYYLFPQNTYNYDRLPRKKSVMQGDFILLLGKISGLRYDEASQSLRWTDSRSVRQALRATLVDTHERGSLYKVGGQSQ